MNDRYTIKVNKEDLNNILYEVWDNCLGDKLFCSFKTQAAVEKLCQKKNAEYDIMKLHGMRCVSYKGPTRSVKNALYRTPKAPSIDKKPSGKSHWFQVLNGLVVLQYA